MLDLSIIIPARNEEFLKETIDDILFNIKGNTEVIAICDGYWPDPPIKDHPKVNLIHHSKPIGQRAATNEGVRLSQAKFIMKVDAHCAFDEGFDVKLMADCKKDWTVIPKMYNLHAFDWKCRRCGERSYQGPPIKKCKKCEGTEHEKIIVWQPREKRLTEFWRFDKDLKFQYWFDYSKRPEAQHDIADTMSSIGACFFMHRQRYIDIDGLDEKHGSWGQVGTEIACKSWLSGGRHVVNRKTWFSHMFRTNNKGFSFPYEISGNDVQKARKYSEKLWKDNGWSKAKYDLKWLVDKFAPVPGWDNNMELSVIIPARNEKFLQQTIDDILKNFKSDFEIIVGLDDCDIELKKDSRVKKYRSEKRIGMRPMINVLVNQAKGRYIMKTDAHCMFDEGYDKKLISIHKKGDTVLGIRYEFNPEREWKRKERTNCDFRYLSHPDVDELGGLRGLAWHEYKKKTKGQKIAETMTISGSGWLMERSQFKQWKGLDERHGTFAQEGAEISCKTWLSGGQVLVNRNTWYAHWNRGKAPYALSTKHRQKSIDHSIDLWMNNKWEFQKYSFQWLIDKFQPPGWPVKKYKGIQAKPQGTLYKGYRLNVNELWDKRVEISEPLKRHRLEIFFLSFEEFLNGNDTRYYNYLVTHLNPVDRNPVTGKGHRHVKKKIASAKKLYKDVKQNGLLAPLEFYIKNGNLILWKGYRRLPIIRKLGFKTVGARVHINEKTAKELSSRFDGQGVLNQLGAIQFSKYSTKASDKYYTHNYLKIYDKIFSELKDQRINILEIGILRGASLKIWHDAFPKATIYGIDKNKTTWKQFTKGVDRIKVSVGMEEDVKFLKSVVKGEKFHIIIHDCNHKPNSQWNTFRVLWKYVVPHGFYVTEDCYRSYRPDNKGINLPAEMSNWVESIYTNREVESLQFFYNMCVVQKGIK